MPELPEVEVVRRGLLPHVLGRRIDAVDVLDARIVRRQLGGPDRLRAVLLGTQVRAVVRRGKFLWWRLVDDRGAEIGEALMTHLGMSGQLRVRTGAVNRTAGIEPPRARDGADGPGSASSPLSPTGSVGLSEGPASDPSRHLRLRITLEDGTAIDMVDQRIFGGLWVSELEPSADALPAGWGSPDDLLPEDARGIARDLLDEHLDRDRVVEVLHGRRAPIKALLLDQAIISGIGNIYADEGLWRSALRYDAPAARISRARLHTLLEDCAEVMREALAVGGTSFDALYVNVDGRSGYFARSLNAYGKEGQPCPRCGTAILREPFQNRSSFRCPRCQWRR